MVSLNAVWVGKDTPHSRQSNWRAKMAIKAGGEEPLVSESAKDNPADSSEDVQIYIMTK